MIIVSPWAKIPRSNINCAKNYPHWQSVIDKLKPKVGEIIQVGVEGEQKLTRCTHKFNLSMKDLKSLLDSAMTWVSVDNFFHHFAHYYNKRGVVIWGKSDPNIFGYPENINLLKDRIYLRKDQFQFWDTEIMDPSSFVSPDTVAENVVKLLS